MNTGFSLSEWGLAQWWDQDGAERNVGKERGGAF